MAGIVGICGNNLSGKLESVTNAVKTTVYSPKVSVAELKSDNNFIAAKSFFSFHDQFTLQASSKGVDVWIDGDVYNWKELSDHSIGNPSELILHHYVHDSLDSLLRKIDGVFIALIYDPDKRQLLIITDRYGLKAFFVYHRKGKLIMAPELKCFPFFADFELKFRSDLIDCFLDLGHMMGTDTWFEGVSFVEPSSVYTYNFSSDSLLKRKYWSWADNPRNTHISSDDAAGEMATLLRKAVQSRADASVRLGISLSGGLDSRAILASVYGSYPVVTYTFGLPQSADVRIARQVASVAGVENKHFHIHVAHWLEKRFQSVWKTDGMLNMYHMHYPHIMSEMQQIIDVNISGFLGDVVLGGSYLEKVYKLVFTKTFVNQRIDEDIAKVYYGPHHSRCDVHDNYFDVESIDPYLIYNRGRRFVIMGIEEAAKLIPQQMPFLENKLMELSYSLPEEQRFGSKVYNKALLQLDSRLFGSIPSASTGMVVSGEQTYLYRLRGQLNYYLELIKIKLGKTPSFVDYHNWVKEPATAALIGKILDPKNALYTQFTSKNFKELYLYPHLQGPRFYTQKIMTALTIELWLQQIFNKKYRES